MIQDKIKDVHSLKSILTEAKEQKKTVVFTNGCFDILHVGHVTYLEEAKKQGDILVIAINTDDSVKRMKGSGRPVVCQEDRLKVLASLQSVDFVTTFAEDDPGSIIKELGPNILIKGSDWKEDEIIGGSYVKKAGGKVITIPFRKGYSSSLLITKIKSLA